MSVSQCSKTAYTRANMAQTKPTAPPAIWASAMNMIQQTNRKQNMRERLKQKLLSKQPGLYKDEEQGRKSPPPAICFVNTK